MARSVETKARGDVHRDPGRRKPQPLHPHEADDPPGLPFKEDGIIKDQGFKILDDAGVGPPAGRPSTCSMTSRGGPRDDACMMVCHI